MPSLTELLFLFLFHMITGFKAAGGQAYVIRVYSVVLYSLGLVNWTVLSLVPIGHPNAAEVRAGKITPILCSPSASAPPGPAPLNTSPCHV